MSVAATRHSLGPLDQIPAGEARVFSVEGRAIAVFRCRSGELFATSAECPHRGGPLADGVVGGHAVICPLHGYLFDLRTGQPVGRECAPLSTYRVTLTGGGDLTVDLA